MRRSASARSRRVGGYALTLATVALAGCASRQPPRALRPVAPIDDAVELAALLPETADRCVVVRPGAVPSRRRALMLYRSWAQADAWSRELDLVAYAEATIASPRARRTYMRFSSATPEVIDHLRSMPLHWLDTPCEDEACRRPVARWVDERTVEIALHVWPRGARSLPTAACVGLAAAQPEAAEVAAEGAPEDTDLHFGHAPILGVRPPHRVHRSLLTSPSRLRVRRVLTFRDEGAAISYAAMRQSLPELLPSLLPLDPGSSEVERVNNRLTIEEQYRWEELELRLEDERLERRAHLHQRERSSPTPLEEIDVTNLAVVRHQVRLRQAELARARGERREAAANELALLLTRAVRAHPARGELATLLARLEMDVLGHPERAAQAMERALASGVAADPAALAVVRREALARIGAAPLARALAEASLARGAAAALMAEDLVRLVEAGVVYEWAEGALHHARALMDHPAASSPNAGTLDILGAVGAIALAVREGDRELYGAAVHVVASWPGAATVRPIGHRAPELLVVRATGARSLAVGVVPRMELEGLRAMGAALASAIPAGPVELVVELSLPGSPGIAVRLSARREGEQLRITRVSSPLAHTSWDAVQRYLAAPIAALPTALFPPPELTVRAASDEEASSLRESTEAVIPGACRVGGPYVRCVAPGRSERLVELLTAMAQGRLSAP